ncbi:MAG: hypothetical protein KF878_33730 [Planctomycetes bacterium]|nr:hypothetical protein [Planctomycetota bacterium]
MGSLNTFYVMGRVARPAVAAGTRHGQPVVTFGVSTSAQGREPVTFEAAGAQAEQALRLRHGQGVFVRGLLRADPVQGGGAALVAQVQALDVVIDGARRPRPPREPREGEPAAGEGAPSPEARGGRGRARRRGRPRASPGPGAEAGTSGPRAPAVPPPRPRSARRARRSARGQGGGDRARARRPAAPSAAAGPAAAGADRGPAGARPAAARPDLPL